MVSEFLDAGAEVPRTLCTWRAAAFPGTGKPLEPVPRLASLIPKYATSRPMHEAIADEDQAIVPLDSAFLFRPSLATFETTQEVTR